MEEYIKLHEDICFLKVDIRTFFDTISHEKLMEILKKKVGEEEVLSLIRSCIKAPCLMKEGEICEKAIGLYQGSSISPVLSNIYLMNFDAVMEQAAAFYIRYSDDMLFLGSTKEELGLTADRVEKELKSYGLEVNGEKTVIGTLTEGFSFLGYHFDKSGKTIPMKAMEELGEKMEVMWLTMGGTCTEDKLKKGAEVLGGWEQYFRSEREISNIYEYTIICYMVQNKEVLSDDFIQKRDTFKNDNVEILNYFVSFWERTGNRHLILKEFEQFYGLQGLDEDKKICQERKEYEELLAIYNKMMILEEEEKYVELIQLYTDLGCYNKASLLTDKKNEYLQNQSASEKKVMIERIDAKEEKDLQFSHGLVHKYMDVLVGREDLFSEETIDGNGKRSRKEAEEPLTEMHIHKHLSGERVLGTYIQRPNNTVKYAVIDVDISKRVLIQHSYGSDAFIEYLKEAANLANILKQELRKMGITAYVEDSGFRGYHVWMFFTEWISTRYVSMLMDILTEKIKNCRYLQDIQVEYFPNKTKMKPGIKGQVMKLPLGIHIRSGKRSSFLDEDFQPIHEYKDFFQDISYTTLSTLKRILSKNSTYVLPEQGVKSVDMDLEAFGDLNGNIKETLNSCNLMRYLCQKARTTGYMTHQERLSVLYVFGHMGDSGKEFIHKIMSFTLNYQYNVTQKYIQRLPEKPISCIKLREQYKQVTAEYGCSCNFKRTKNCYPSPVLHALKSGKDTDEEITVPTSRALTKEVEKQVCEEVNVHKRVQDLAVRILDMKKQQRGIQKSIVKIEKELCDIYDTARVECMEIDMGLLVRRKTEEAYEWVIEI